MNLRVWYYRKIMRKFILIELAIFLAIVSSVRAQQTNSPTSPPNELTSTNASSSAHSAGTNTAPAYKQTAADLKIQRKLVGTWIAIWGQGQTTKNVIAKDGSYTSWTEGLPKGQMGGYNGTFLVKNGIVENRAKFGPETITTHLHILQLDSHELVWSNENGGMATFRRVEK